MAGKREERLRDLLSPDAAAVTARPVLSSLLTPRSCDYLDHLHQHLDAHDRSETWTPEGLPRLLLTQGLRPL